MDAADLARAFDAAVGRAGAFAPSPALLRFARRVVAAGRRVEAAPPCPRACLARAEALFHVRPGRCALLRLLFDSWRAAPAASRGASTSRLLRYGGGAGTLDLELTSGVRGALSIRGVVEGPWTRMQVEVARRGAKGRRIPVGASGAFSLDLEAGRLPVSLTVLGEGVPVLRAARIPPAGE